MAADDDKMKITFDNKMQELIAKKHSNTQILSKTAYYEMISRMEKLKQMTTGKKPSDYAKLKHYDVECSDDGVKRLFVPKKPNQPTADILYYVHTDELFGVLHEAHLKTNHGGRGKMLEALKSYKNITREIIVLYSSLCQSCENKRWCITKRNYQNNEKLIFRKIYFRFIQMNEADDKYKYVFLYIDCDTQFIQLRPSKTNTAYEAANILEDIFSILGPSQVLECGMGKQFCEEVIKELLELPLLNSITSHETSYFTTADNIFNGRIKSAVMKIVNLLMQQTSANTWAKELKLIQLSRNNIYDQHMQCTPYQAMFRGESTTTNTFNNSEFVNCHAYGESQHGTLAESVSSSFYAVTFDKSGIEDTQEPPCKILKIEGDIDSSSHYSNEFTPTIKKEELYIDIKTEVDSD